MTNHPNTPPPSALVTAAILRAVGLDWRLTTAILDQLAPRHQDPTLCWRGALTYTLSTLAAAGVLEWDTVRGYRLAPPPPTTEFHP